MTLSASAIPELAKLTHLKPAFGRVAIRLLEGTGRSAGGLYLPAGPETLATVGVVHEVCEEYHTATSGAVGPIYTIGQTVVFGKYNGVEITLDHCTPPLKLVVLDEEDILGTLTPELTVEG